jgi:uncharacterized membrane protein YqgA involved in biofilm formation
VAAFYQIFAHGIRKRYRTTKAGAPEFEKITEQLAQAKMGSAQICSTLCSGRFIHDAVACSRTVKKSSFGKNRSTQKTSRRPWVDIKIGSNKFMLGVLVNSAAVIIGAMIGLLGKRLISEPLLKQIQLPIGYCTILLGIKMGLEFQHFLWVMGAVLLGGVIGHLCKIEKRIESFGGKLERLTSRSKKDNSNFVYGFTTTSILFCSGAMAIMGSINSGARGDHQLLFTKSILDGITSVPMAAIYGIGVAFSSLAILVYQGGIALLASLFQSQFQAASWGDVSGVGGVLLIMTGCNLAGIAKVAVGDFIPAILLIVSVYFLLN